MMVGFGKELDEMSEKEVGDFAGKLKLVDLEWQAVGDCRIINGCMYITMSGSGDENESIPPWVTGFGEIED